MEVSVSNVWVGDINSLNDPQDMKTIEISKKEVEKFGTGEDKVNVGIEYDVTDINYAANISLAIVFDKTIMVYQTNLPSVQGKAIMYLRLPYLPKYANKKKVGVHALDIVVKLRPRWSVWHLIDNYKDFTELQSVAEVTENRTVIIRE